MSVTMEIQRLYVVAERRAYKEDAAEPIREMRFYATSSNTELHQYIYDAPPSRREFELCLIVPES